MHGEPHLQGIKKRAMKDQNKERRKRSIKLALIFALLALIVYLGSMYMLWMH